MNKIRYYYCEEDNYGQHTGIVGSIEMTEEEYREYMKHYNENIKLNIRYLYRSYTEALSAALN